MNGQQINVDKKHSSLLIFLHLFFFFVFFIVYECIYTSQNILLVFSLYFILYISFK